MAYEKTHNLLDLAIWMQSGRDGVSLSEIADKYKVSYRTAERMRDMIMERFQQTVEVIGEKDAILYAHSISTTNSCQLCSLFFISDVKGLGLDPANLQYDEKEQALASLGQQIVKNPTAVSDELFDTLKKFWTDQEIVVIVGFAGQMIATNNFNSVLKIDVDQRLLPIINEFKPATWRENIK